MQSTPKLMSWYLAAAMSATALATSSTSTVFAQEERSTKISVMIVSTKLALGVHEDVERVKSVFEMAEEFVGESDPEHCPEFSRPIVVMAPSSQAELLRRIDDPDVTSETTLVCYCKLHGGADVNGKHYMRMDTPGADSIITRDLLLERLKQRGARLTMLITDSCASGPIQPVPTAVQAAKYPTKMFMDLFVYPKGVVDINSASSHIDGRPVFQFAWMDAEGALFTKAFSETLTPQGPRSLTELLSSVDRNNDNRYSWTEYFDALSGRVDEEYQRFKAQFLAETSATNREPTNAVTYARILNQQHQTPHAFSELPSIP